MKKTWIAAILAGLLALGLCACGGTPSAAATTTGAESATAGADSTTTQPASVQAPVPAPDGYGVVEGPAEIEAQLDLFVSIPQQAEDITYGIVADRYAYMTFIFEGTAYQYSVGKGAGNVYPDSREYAEHENTDWLEYPYTLDWNDDGSGRASWFDSATETAYQLTAASGTTRDKLSELAVILLPAG